MVRYRYLYPILFKAFSATPLSRKLYRYLGNTAKDRIKQKRQLRENYIIQGRKIVRLLAEFADIKPGDTLMELGTGWLHWYATFVRLFHDVSMYAYDVWDNRQFRTLKAFYSQLASRLSEDELSEMELGYLLKEIPTVESFEEFYQLTDINYVIEPSGKLDIFPDNKFKALFSCAVFEHIPKEGLPAYLANMNRILKPGGYSIQIIDIGDHYHYLDRRGTHHKQYLVYSEKLWKRWFENTLTYINRVQASEWLQLFEEAGFELVHQEKLYVEIDSLDIASDYRKYSPDDLTCHQMVTVHRKI